MIRYTTPTIRIREKTSDLSSFDELLVTISQMSVSITKTPVVDGDVMSIRLTQTESAMFRADFPCEVMVNAMKNDDRYASNLMHVDTFKNLLNEVIDDA